MQISEKRILPAFLLLFFLGLFGAHRFYTGKIASGIVMIILTITIFGVIITGIWCLIDFITLVVGGFRDADGRVIKEWV